MREQHLSDEAIAAFADDVLSGSARGRAQRHTATCAECNYAVAVQREAVWALRSAPAPTLSSDLLKRLRDVPATTPIHQVPTHVDENGTEMFATFAAPAAALVPPARPTGRGRTRRGRPLVITAASVAVLGALAGSAVAADSGPAGHPGVRNPVGSVTSDVQLIRADLPVHPW